MVLTGFNLFNADPCKLGPDKTKCVLKRYLKKFNKDCTDCLKGCIEKEKYDSLNNGHNSRNEKVKKEKSMITRITKKQQEQFYDLMQKYINDITVFPELDIKEAAKAVNLIYESMGYQKPLLIVAKNPYEAVLMSTPIKMDSDSQLRSQLDSQLSSQLYSQLSSQLYSQLDSQLSSQLESQLSSQLYSQLRSQLQRIEGTSWYLSLYWRYWDCYYQFAKTLGVEFDNEKLDLFHNFSTNVYFCVPFDGICFISEPPLRTYWNNKKQLHRDGGCSVEFKSSLKNIPTFGVWSLNGVLVPRYLVETPASMLDIEFFKNEKNADIKAQFIKKYGIERMMSLGRVIDTWENHKDTKNYEWYKKSEYKIIDMSPIFSSYKYMPYLYMKNQTVPGIYHLECCYDAKNLLKEQPMTILDGLKVRFDGIDPESVEINAIA